MLLRIAALCLLALLLFAATALPCSLLVARLTAVSGVLALSLGVMFLLHFVQREEEALVIDCQQYCLEHLTLRLYDPEPVDGSAEYAVSLGPRL